MGNLIEYLKKNKLKSAVFFAGAALWPLTMADRGLLDRLFPRVPFYCMLALFLGWGAALAAFAYGNRQWMKDLLKRNRGVFLFSLGMTVLIFLSVKPEFRVLSDETNLLAVSKSMLYEKRVDNVTMGKWYYSNFQQITREQEKRPYAFPFSVYLAHTLTGYRVSNPFAVNFLLTCLLFCAAGAFFNGLYGPFAALVAILLAAAQPLLTLTATSAGMDLMSLAFIFFSFLTLREYIRREDSASFTLLWATMLVMANARYENPLFMAAVAACLLISGKLKPAVFSSWQFAFTPFIMLPVFWQRFCRGTNFENPAGSAAFSAANFANNSLLFFRTNADTGFFYPYAALVNAVGLAVLAYLLYRLVTKRWPASPGDRPLAWTSLCVMALYWAVICSFNHAGSASHPANARYFLPAVFALSLLAASLAGRAATGRPAAALLLASLAFLLYHPVAVENRFYNTLLLGREFRWQAEFLERTGDRNIMVISGRPGQFTAMNYGAVTFEYARQHSSELLTELQQHLFVRLIVFQAINYSTNEPVENDRLGPEFVLTTLEERQNTADSFLRISEVFRGR